MRDGLDDAREAMARGEEAARALGVDVSDLCRKIRNQISVVRQKYEKGERSQKLQDAFNRGVKVAIPAEDIDPRIVGAFCDFFLEKSQGLLHKKCSVAVEVRDGVELSSETKEGERIRKHTCSIVIHVKDSKLSF